MKTQHIYLLFLAMLLWQSCGKETDGCPQSTNEFYNLTDEEKNKVPYTGSDTLVFISDKGDTATLLGQGKKQTYKNITLTLGNPDCGGTSSKNYEVLSISHTNTKTNNEIMNLSYEIYVSDFDRTGGLRLKVNNSKTYDYDLKGSNNNKIYSDTTYLNSKLYNGIYLKNEQDTNNKFLFNYQFGILNIKNLNNKNWYRKL